jgi:ATP-binding protein involved in chromosome partitioning
MKVIPVQALKGGVGKTKICVGLGRALASLGYKVGFIDVDWVAPNLHLQLGIDDDIELVLSSGVGDKIQPVISPEGFPVLSSSFIFPSDQAICMDEASTIRDIEEIISNGVVEWGDLDYLLMDTPPTTSRFISAALSVSNMQGVVLVVQPAVSAMADLVRTLSLLQDQRVPVLGLIGNQVYVNCPHGDRINLYELGEEDIRSFCGSHKIPYLGSLPHILPREGAAANDIPGMTVIASRLRESEPVFLEKDVFSRMPYKLLLALAKRRKGSLERRREDAQNGEPEVQ